MMNLTSWHDPKAISDSGKVFNAPNDARQERALLAFSIGFTITLELLMKWQDELSASKPRQVKTVETVNAGLSMDDKYFTFE